MSVAKKNNFQINTKDPSALLTLLRTHGGFSGEEEEEEVMVANDEQALCLLIKETGTRGVLDSACSKTVAGVHWMTEFCDQLPHHLKKFTCQKSSKVYQFGGGEKRLSLGCLLLPIVIGNKRLKMLRLLKHRFHY